MKKTKTKKFKLKKPSKEVLERARDFNWVIRNECYTFDKMDRGQLLQALMDSVELIDTVEGTINELSRALEDYRQGVPGNWDE